MKWTDAEFEVVKPRTRKELPGWFKLLLFGLVALMLLARPIWRFNEDHSGSPAEASSKAAQPAPPAQ